MYLFIHVLRDVAGPARVVYDRGRIPATSPRSVIGARGGKLRAWREATMHRPVMGAVSIGLLGLLALGARGEEPPAGREPIRTGKVFRLEEVEAQREQTGRPWLEFLTVPDLSLGLYALAAGEEDLQTPHLEDEVYLVVKGKAVVVIAGERTPVGPGSIVYVVKGIEHRFEDIEEDLEVLVLFSVGKEGP
jgi:mannose-6-phosphate isomerase-like protein (cupin superfamily)